jgi:hypothetical protein
MNNIEESTANHEIISALIVAVGMISLMMNQVTGLLVILAGTGSLVLVYSFRLFATPDGSTGQGRAGLISRLNYVVLIAGLAMMVILIFAAHGRMIFAGAGITLLIALAVTDLLVCRRRYFRMKLGHCLLRIGLIAMLLLLFYFFPIR